MARTTPSAFTFRLSCGCLTILPGVQANKDGYVTSRKKGEVLCARCREGVSIVRRYPPPYASCATETWAHDASGRLVHVRCCCAQGHEGEHEDEILGVRFADRETLRGGGAGNTRRA